MRTKLRLPLVGTVLAVVACSNPFARDATLELFLDTNDSWTWFPPAEDERVKPVTGLDDPKGYAGLEIVLAGAVERRYTAADFADSSKIGPFRVPDAGVVTLTARIVQDGQVVAEIGEHWGLESEVAWDLDISRSPYPGSEGFHGVDELESPECFWFWCAFVWRSPITDEAANYEYEALWVVLYREHPDECADVCP